MKKTLYNTVSWLNEEGPFITIVQPSSFEVKHSLTNKLYFKNLMKDAKIEFEKKYPEHDFKPYEKAMESVYNDHDLWRSDSDALLFITNGKRQKVLKLGINVEAHAYVDSIPYIIPLMHDLQLLTHFYVLALNRDSFRIYEYSNNKLAEIELPEDAPTTLEIAIGQEKEGAGFAHGATRMFVGVNRGYYGGVGSTRDERAVDRQNYFYAVERFAKISGVFSENIPIILFTLPENRSIFFDISKLINLDKNLGILASPEDFRMSHLQKETEESANAINERTVAKVFDNLERYKDSNRILQDEAQIKEQSTHGSIHTLLVNIERLDAHDYEVNRIFYDVMESGGDVYLLHQDHRLGPEKMTALLRYNINET
ncbi:MAG: hypothetical protein GX038_06880 [Erysipelothrix sp.]|nr:hypothetical protein [Erysipelothrix sp.]